MNSDSSKLRHEQKQDLTAELQGQQQQASAKEFGSPEELIRFDSLQTVPPATIAERLKESIEREPKPNIPWWKKLFKSD